MKKLVETIFNQVDQVTRFQNEIAEMNLLEKNLRKRPIKMNPLRRIVDSILMISEKDSLPLRKLLEDDDYDKISETYRISNLKISLLDISEKKPFTLIFGLLALLYLSVYFILKLTIL